ncbi:MAG TPA: YebC/PmpR family DNA-binding transcriptional regulator [Acidobacteriota bacterium]
MSGHSKWSTIKRKKGAADIARGKIFSRLTKEVTVAAKQGGGDPDSNPRLRAAIAAAKVENMPADNIKRAIQRGTGELPGVVYEEVTYEGFGPGGVAVLVQTATDNRNRTVSEIRKIFERGGGTMAEVNSVSWMFRQVGYFLVDAESIDEDDLLLVALEAGAEDVSTDDGMYEVTTAPAEFSDVRDALERHGIKTESGELAMLPSSYVKVEGREAERCLALMEKLEEHDDVQGVFSNADIDAEQLERAAAG